MATSEDATADAERASRALRRLAHTTRHLPRAADSSAVLGDLLSSLGSLEQVLKQLADLHVRHAGESRTDDGNPTAGRIHAAAAASELQRAAAALLQSNQHLDSASASSSRIVWPTPASKLPDAAVAPAVLHHPGSPSRATLPSSSPIGRAL